ncbi:MAG: hypothetical protein M3069_30085 [Chloroflexota bacterium]|nr:hypothetical protein [Chloroflexota bacterium]
MLVGVLVLVILVLPAFRTRPPVQTVPASVVIELEAGPTALSTQVTLH